MANRIKNLDEMYNASYTLQKQLVEGNNEYSIDTILQNLKDNIDTLKDSWHGIDSSIHINNIINVTNTLIDLRKKTLHLANFITDLSSYYLDVVRANLENGTYDLPLYKNKTLLQKLALQPDGEDTIYIDEKVIEAKRNIGILVKNIESLKIEQNNKYIKILENWIDGNNREEYVDEVNKYLKEFELLETTAKTAYSKLSTSINNYLALDKTTTE